MATHQSEQVRSARLGRAQARPAQAPAVGRVVGLRVLDGRSLVTVRLPGCPDSDVALAGVPDPGLARTLTTGFRRLAWVRIDASGTNIRCEVSGIARRPHRCRLPLAAALALAEADVPTVVRLRPVRS